ncbi:DUF4340 domain-containing protein [Konateibacter massiliensis]|uniref:DUF4340 domain-containing protein n=1 Tax=Konateibacter massiliensis TaxID=2002841 RepID=UPI0015D49ED3|nr:DUF4340 domain-containing protein [Konateibacter massiliensis]
MTKKNKTVKLISLLVLLILAIAAYFVVEKINKDNEEKEAQEEAADTIIINSVETDKIASFSYIYDGTTYVFSKDGDTWYCANEAGTELDQILVENLIKNFESVEATRLVEENAADLSQYGLDEPANVISVTDTDGTTISYEIGNENQTVSEYYMKKSDNNTVYLVGTFATSFQKTIEDLKAAEDETTDEITQD